MSLYADMLNSTISGRHVIDLAPGMGKTTSIVCLTATIHELGLSEHSILICASKVEALCSLKRAMISEGIPESKIGLLHSYDYSPSIAASFINGETDIPDKYASEPVTVGNENRQFMLVTHNRIKGKRALSEYNIYKGENRSLVIWDESLIKSKGISVPLLGLERGVGMFKPEARRSSNPLMKEALNFLENAVDEIIAVIDNPTQTVQFFEADVPQEEIKKFKSLFNGHDYYKPVKAFLSACSMPLRIVDIGNGSSGLIGYTVDIPIELENIVALDASFGIRKRGLLDEGINHFPLTGVVDYSNLTIHHMKGVGAGRGAVTGNFKKANPGKKIAEEVGEVVQSIPADEAVLIFTFKERGTDFKREVERQLTSMGIDVNATVRDDKPRFAWLTLGNEASLNEYAYCQNVIFVGALHLSHTDIAACIAGQLEDLHAHIDLDLIRDIEESEVAYGIHQGLTRTACRVIRDGVAGRANAWFMFRNESIVERLKMVLPGAHLNRGRPCFYAFSTINSS